MKTGIGAANGLSKQPFDRWFRYPAGFSEESLSACFAATKLQPGDLLIDPFAGVGTTGVHSAHLGAKFVGIEVHPLVAELASIKFSKPEPTSSLSRIANQVVSNLPSCSVDDEQPLIKRCFSPAVLEKLVAMREAINQLQDDPFHLHLKWCLLGILRDCASVKTAWPYQRPSVARLPRSSDPCRAFLHRADFMEHDLYSTSLEETGSIYTGDSRHSDTWALALGGASGNTVVSSPPYLNNFDYADATRLELYFSGLARSWREMTTIVRSEMVVATTQQSKKSTATAAKAALRARCPLTADKIEELSISLENERRKRRNGKQYELVLPSYFADLVSVLANIRDFTYHGARVALVLGDSAPYGVYVNTPELLAGAATEIGFSCMESRLLRHRGLRWAKNGTRHSVPLSEKMIVLCSPGRL